MNECDYCISSAAFISTPNFKYKSLYYQLTEMSSLLMNVAIIDKYAIDKCLKKRVELLRLVKSYKGTLITKTIELSTDLFQLFNN